MFNALRAASAALLILVLSAVVGVTPANASDDLTAPVFVSLGLSPASVDTSATPQTLTLTAHVTDALSGFTYGNLVMQSPSGNQSFSLFFSASNRTSGTANDGEYTIAQNLPRYSEPGLWQVSYASLTDETNNSAYLSAASLADAGLGVTFVQTGAGDTTAPVLTDLALSPALVDTSASAQTLTLTANVTDDLAGVAYGYLTMASPSGNQSLNFNLWSGAISSGTPQAGEYILTATLPRFAEAGVWVSRDASFMDEAGNWNNLSAADLAVAGLAVTFTQIDTGDTSPPAAMSMSIEPVAVDTSDSSQTLTLSTHVTDDISGFAYGYVYSYSPSTSQYISFWLGASERTSGTAGDGEYSSSISLPRYSEHGVWQALYVVLVDEAGNNTFLTGAGLGPDGLDVSFTQSGVTAPTAPSAPVALAGDSLATLTWSPPLNDGGSAITSYTVTTFAGATVVSSTPTTGTSATVSGLTNGTAYTFTVTATNENGAGAASAASNAVTPATLPGAPTIGTAIAGDGEASVVFTPPVSDGGSAIASYTVVATSVLAPTEDGQTATGATSPITVTGLTNGVSYTFTVTPTNAVGDGAPSDPSNAVVPVGQPGAPSDVEAIAGDGSATVSWAAPAITGGLITGYEVTGSPSGTATVDGSVHTATVTGLTNGVTYTFTVAATNPLGSGAASDPSASVVPVGKPGAPTGVSAIAGSGSATVGWAAPVATGGTPITSYSITAIPSGTAFTVDASARTAEVTGLTNGTAYTFTVHATNAQGDSAESALSTAVIPTTTPGAPTAVTVVAGDGSATVSWTAPTSTGGSPVTAYTVTGSPFGTAVTADGVTLTATVTGLANGTSHTFSVHATNARGDGPASAVSAAVTPSTAPGTPTGVSAVAGNGSATVSWTAPASTGGVPVTSYKVTASPGSASAVTANGMTLISTVTGLTNGTAYSFTVQATNARGTSAGSAASAAVTPVGAPVPTAKIATPSGKGQWLVESDGGVFPFGDAATFGSMAGANLNKPIVGMAASPTGKGYWLVASDGGIFAFGDAAFAGSTGGISLNKPIVGMAATPTGKGYWLVASDGGIFAFGDAAFAGSTGGIPLNRPIVGMAATPTGKGYWLVASDGGIFAFGDAAFAGSTGGIPLNKPIVGMASTPTGKGYWLVALDGGIFAFGDAAFLGSTGAIVINGAIVGMAASPTGEGYRLVASDGGVFAYGDALFLGSAGGLPLNRPIVAQAASN